MTHSIDVRLGSALTCWLMLGGALPTSLSAQELAYAAQLEQQAWPRWEGASGTPDAGQSVTAPQDLAPGSDARVLGFPRWERRPG